MTTQSKLTLINGETDQKGGIFLYRAMRSFKVACEPGNIAVPPLPFPDDDDYWDDLDQADNKSE